MFCPFEMFDDCRTDIALAEADYIGNEYASKVTNNLHCLSHRNFLEVSQSLGYLVVPQDISGILTFQSIFHKIIERFHIDIIWPDRSNGPRLLHFTHERLVKILRLVPELIKPGGQGCMIIVTLHNHIEFGIMADT